MFNFIKSIKTSVENAFERYIDWIIEGEDKEVAKYLAKKAN